jgi:hypothetical protein
MLRLPLASVFVKRCWSVIMEPVMLVSLFGLTSLIVLSIYWQWLEIKEMRESAPDKVAQTSLSSQQTSQRLRHRNRFSVSPASPVTRFAKNNEGKRQNQFARQAQKERSRREM